MSYSQLNSVDKLHANLLEIGKQIRRLKWLVIIISFFFGYLALRYDTQPDYFEISFFGKLSISKTDVVLFGPVIVALLNLALGLSQSYSFILIRRFSEIALSGADKNSVNTDNIILLQYPTTDALFAVLSSDNNLTPFVRKLFGGLGFIVRISFSFLSIGAYIVVIWKGFRYSPNILIDRLLYLTTIPLAFSLVILFSQEIVILYSAIYNRLARLARLTRLDRLVRLVRQGSHAPLSSVSVYFLKIVIAFVVALFINISTVTIYTRFFRPPYLDFSAKISNIVDLSQLPTLFIQVDGTQVQNLKMIAMTIENTGREAVRNMQLSWSFPETAEAEVHLIQVAYRNEVKEYTDTTLISLGNLKPAEMIKVNLLVTNISEYDLEQFMEVMISSDYGYLKRLKLTN